MTVIVLIGIITAVAAPRFVELSGVARQGSTEAVAGSLGSASALNHATDILFRANEGTTDLFAAVPIDSCGDEDVAELLTNGVPPGYRIEVVPGAQDPVALGESTSCRVFNEADDDVFADFTLYGTDPL